ncbi:unnamed protein product [Meganyctiphanes norvegica]|uniref:Uncharacterized protein n=1 Tax=Meganyctiphanes norvegica TaxID=48144 RepID=A0AAV2SDP7_MEGNR
MEETFVNADIRDPHTGKFVHNWAASPEPKLLLHTCRDPRTGRFVPVVTHSENLDLEIGALEATVSRHTNITDHTIRVNDGMEVEQVNESGNPAEIKEMEIKNDPDTPTEGRT